MFPCFWPSWRFPLPEDGHLLFYSGFCVNIWDSLLSHPERYRKMLPLGDNLLGTSASQLCVLFILVAEGFLLFWSHFKSSFLDVCHSLRTDEVHLLHFPVFHFSNLSIGDILWFLIPLLEPGKKTYVHSNTALLKWFPYWAKTGYCCGIQLVLKNRKYWLQHIITNIRAVNHRRFNIGLQVARGGTTTQPTHFPSPVRSRRQPQMGTKWSRFE